MLISYACHGKSLLFVRFCKMLTLITPIIANMAAMQYPITESHGLSSNSPSSSIEVVRIIINTAKQNSKIGISHPFLIMPVLFIPSIIKINPTDNPIAHIPGASSKAPKANNIPPIKIPNPTDTMTFSFKNLSIMTTPLIILLLCILHKQLS